MEANPRKEKSNVLYDTWKDGGMEALKKMKVADLKLEMRSFDLKLTGNKQELVERLNEYFTQTDNKRKSTDTSSEVPEKKMKIGEGNDNLIVKVAMEGHDCDKIISIPCDIDLDTSMEAVLGLFAFNDFGHMYMVTLADGKIVAGKLGKGLKFPGLKDPIYADEIRWKDCLLKQGDKISMIFDLGDEWKFSLEVQDVKSGSDKDTVTLIESHGVPPPQYPTISPKIVPTCTTNNFAQSTMPVVNNKSHPNPVKRGFAKLGKILPMADDLRPTVYEDPEESWIRGVIITVFLILMALIAAGVIGYKFTHKGNVSKRINEPSQDQVFELFKKDKNGEITNLECICKTTKRNKDLGIDLPDTVWDIISNDCSDATASNEFTNFCIGLSQSLGAPFSNNQVAGSLLLDKEEYSAEQADAWIGDCYSGLDDMRWFYLNLWLYFINAGVDTTAFDSGEADTFFDDLEQMMQDKDYCFLETFDDYIPYDDWYNQYYQTCEVPNCTWFEDQSDLEAFMWALALLGTIWSIAFFFAALAYGFLYPFVMEQITATVSPA